MGTQTLLGLLASLATAAILIFSIYLSKTAKIERIKSKDQDEDYLRIRAAIEKAETLTAINNIYGAIRSFSDRYNNDVCCHLQVKYLMSWTSKKALKIEPINFYDNMR